MLDPVLHVWDAAAVRPIIEEAGGVFSDWTGAPTHLAGHAVGTNERLADAVRAELARSGEDGP
jgi:histidinol-phosphatase